MYDMYDVFLSSTCDMLPDLSSLAESSPLLAHPAFAQGCLHLSRCSFLGLDLEPGQALALLHRLHRAGAVGSVAPVRYRQQRLSVEEAKPLAKKAIADLQTLHFPGDTFNPVTFRQEGATTWLFGAPCLRLVLEGYIPGSLFVAVDKLDGHIWDEEALMHDLLSDKSS